MIRNWTDHSIFMGVAEYHLPEGCFRVENMDSGVFRVLKKIGSAYVQVALVRLSRDGAYKSAMKAFLAVEDMDARAQ